MKIRTLCLMGIIPVFLLLGLSISIFVCYFEYRETMWGLHESASSMVVTTSEFFFGTPFEHLYSKQTNKKQREELLKPLYTAVRYKNFQWIFAYSFYDESLVYSITQEEGQVFPEQDFAGIARQLKDQDVIFSSVQTTTDNQKFIRAYRTVYDTKYQPSGIVGVQLDANILRENLSKSIKQSLKGSTLCLIAGLLCSLFISKILKRDIDVLNINYDENISSLAKLDLKDSKTSFIREIRDLSNTFETMFSVLKTVMTNSWQNILDVELLRSERDIAKKYKNICMNKNRLKNRTIYFLSEIINPDRMDIFSDFFEYNTHIYCLFGRIIPVENDLQTTLSISSMITFFKINIQKESTSQAIEKTLQLYPCSDFQLLEWEEDNRQLLLHVYNPSTHLCESRQLEFQNGKMKVFHNLCMEAEKRIALYLKTYYQKQTQGEKNMSEKISEETFLLPLRAEELMNKMTSLSKEYADASGGVIVLTLKLK
ncbi:MAG: hypothetical protein HQK75_15885 [Candidatus Magnetomorum sp.]|nr:hypothetical protein [Candidatus Magnetomorum sp.]